MQPEFYIPDGADPSTAKQRCTHLGIGAHPDDLEFMAYHGISHGYEQAQPSFGGIICTNGAGCSRAGKYSHCSDEEMIRLRAEEQRAAARIGRYTFVQQLGLQSATVKARATRDQLTDTIADLIAHCRPEVIYTHNPLDSHSTHVAVCQTVVNAVRLLAPEMRPKQLLGCEVWRGLDWVPQADKVALDVSANPELAERLHACFDSQIAGGKNYGQAVVGRSLANATFYQARERDGPARIWFALDLSRLLKDESLALASFTESLLQRFHQSIADNLRELPHV